MGGGKKEGKKREKRIRQVKNNDDNNDSRSAAASQPADPTAADECCCYWLCGRFGFDQCLHRIATLFEVALTVIDMHGTNTQLCRLFLQEL